MPKENNHYVPRLLLRKFNEKISTYNLKTKELKIGQKLEDIFVIKKLYTLEIEDLFNEKIENEFALLLNKKILNVDNECIFTRLEVRLIKKFLLLAMLRATDGEKFMQHNLEKTRTTVKDMFKFEEKNTESLTPFDYWMRTLKCILESKCLEEISNHPLATAKAVYWAYTFNVGYISIWDSTTSKEEFVVMDQGMTSEHEFTRFVEPFNNDVIKKGYLIKEMEKNKNSKEAINNLYAYLQLLNSNMCMSENMYLFTISKNRMIALINPFYRLYDKNDYENTSVLAKPNIWVSGLQNKELFLKNRNKYINGEEAKYGKFDDKDIFIYPIRQMELEDVLYINCLILDRIHEFVGFSETSGIRRSIITYSAINKKLNNYSGLINELENLGYEMKITDKYIKITKIFNEVYRTTNEEMECINSYLRMKEQEKKFKDTVKI